MKLDNELKYVVSKLKEIKDKIPPYAAHLKESGGYEDFETRLAWDCLRVAMGTTWICNMYTKYDCNDTHITTLAKRALKEVYKM